MRNNKHVQEILDFQISSYDSLLKFLTPAVDHAVEVDKDYDNFLNGTNLIQRTTT